MPSENKEKLMKEARIGIIIFIALLASVLIMMFFFIFNNTATVVPSWIFYVTALLGIAAFLFLVYVIWLSIRIKENKGSNPDAPKEVPKEVPKESEDDETSTETDNQ